MENKFYLFTFFIILSKVSEFMVNSSPYISINGYDEDDAMRYNYNLIKVNKLIKKNKDISISNRVSEITEDGMKQAGNTSTNTGESLELNEGITISTGESSTLTEESTSSEETTSTAEPFTTESPVDVGLIVGLSVGIPLGLIFIAICAWILFRYFKCSCAFEMNDEPLCPCCSKCEKNTPNEPKNHYPGDAVTLAINHNFPCEVAKNSVNYKKNFIKDILPYDNNRVLIGDQGDDDYINASPIDDLFIAVQDTKDGGEYTFWKMIWEMEVTCIIRLTNSSRRTSMSLERGHLYGDKKGTSWEHGDPNSSKELNVKVKEVGEMNPNILQKVIQISDGKNDKDVMVLEIASWSINRSNNNNKVNAIHFVRMIKQYVKKNNMKAPIVVESSGGSGEVGVFIGLWRLLEKKDQGNILEENHIYLIINEFRSKRQKMIDTQEQLDVLKICLSETMKGNEYH